MFIIADVNVEKDAEGFPLSGPAVILAAFHERDLALQALEIDAGRGVSGEKGKSTRFEARYRYDYMTINSPGFDVLEKGTDIIEAYVTADRLIVLAGDPVLQRLKTDIWEDVSGQRTPAMGLSIMFSYILSKDTDLLESIENEIEKLEERAAVKKPEDHTIVLISMRKQLLALKRYYEAIFDLLEDLEENINGIFSQDQIQAFRLHRNRAGRLRDNVMSLQDYLTHVREAYQNQLDISLNETMQFFTVITAVFLPLTLIVGWYGMNLRMPELAFGITYPVVCVVSLVFVILSLWFCKRKGWF